MPSYPISSGKQVPSVGSSSPKQSPTSPVTTTSSPISVPTTEPPSYASTMQALAMQKGMVAPSAQHIHHPLPPPPYTGDDICRTGSGPIVSSRRILVIFYYMLIHFNSCKNCYLNVFGLKIFLHSFVILGIKCRASRWFEPSLFNCFITPPSTSKEIFSNNAWRAEVG